MRILAFDTTGRVASCAVLEDGKLLDSICTDPSLRHAETVLPCMNELLSRNHLELKDFDYLAVDVGPGSFTGVRIGVTIANAIGFALHIRVIPVDSLEVMFEQCGRPAGTVLSLMDALHGNCYASAYQDGVLAEGPSAPVAEEFLSRWDSASVRVGDMKGICTHMASPDACNVAKAALRRISLAEDTVVPLYLKPSQAERKAMGQE